MRARRTCPASYEGEAHVSGEDNRCVPREDCDRSLYRMCVSGESVTCSTAVDERATRAVPDAVMDGKREVT